MSNKKELKVSEVRDFVCDVQARIEALDLMAGCIYECADQTYQEWFKIAFDSVMKETKAMLTGYEMHLHYGVEYDGSTSEFLNMQKAGFLARGMD